MDWTNPACGLPGCPVAVPVWTNEGAQLTHGGPGNKTTVTVRVVPGFCQIVVK